MSMVTYHQDPYSTALAYGGMAAWKHRHKIWAGAKAVGGVMAKYAPGVKKSFSRQTGGRKGGGSNPVGSSSSAVMTQYHDNKVTYRAKRSRGRKYKKSFKARTLRVMRNDAPAQQVIISDTNVVTNSNQGEQSMFMIAGLNTWYGDGTFPGDKDMYKVSNTFADSTIQATNNQTSGTITGAVTYEATSSKVLVKSSRMDIIIQSPTGSTPTIIDLYEAYCRKDVFGYGAPESPLLQIDRGLNNQGLGGNAGASRNQYGVTPFQLQQFTSVFKITKKTRAILQPDQPLQYSMSDGKSKVLSGEYFRGLVGTPGQLLPSKKGWTKVLVACCYKGPELVTGTAVVPAVGSVQFSITKCYNVKQINSKPKTGTFVQL